MNLAVTRHAAKTATVEPNGDLLARCEHALELLLTHRGNPSVEIERVLAEDPQCVLAHCLRAAIIVRADANAARSTLAASVAAIEAACPDIDAPARRHAAAARAWLEGDSALALERYGGIVIDSPRDILALVVAHALDFRLGRRRMMRDRITQVLPEWDAAMPGHASILAMYAFALEENGQYRRAERMARRVLALDPQHVGAIHVVVHVMEMQGRTREGLAFLTATQSAWVEGTDFSVHLAWHLALLQLDADDLNSALATYDSQIENGRATDMSELADASALLWLLQLRSVEVSERWRRLADRWDVQTLAGARPFYVVHAMMAFVAAGRAAAAARALEALPGTERNAAPSALSEDALARNFCEALLAFSRSEYAACVDWLTRVRHIAHRCGGSLAQCDLIHLTFTEAALRAQRAGLARALVAERTAQKPASRLNRLLQRRLAMITPGTRETAAVGKFSAAGAGRSDLGVVLAPPALSKSAKRHPIWATSDGLCWVDSPRR
jgi:tetratricopeptide (TPR) repeat protein